MEQCKSSWEKNDGGGASKGLRFSAKTSSLPFENDGVEECFPFGKSWRAMLHRPILLWCFYSHVIGICIWFVVYSADDLLRFFFLCLRYVEHLQPTTAKRVFPLLFLDSMFVQRGILFQERNNNFSAKIFFWCFKLKNPAECNIFQENIY